ncbi:MAG: hypothetical protein WC744_02620 [Patescibacteria group bacterium]|jgi:thiosulfate reductase cytochrome b subunit
MVKKSKKVSRRITKSISKKEVHQTNYFALVIFTTIVVGLLILTGMVFDIKSAWGF